MRLLPIDLDSGGSVLAVTSEVPWPLDSGGHLRTFHVLRSLAARMPVCLLAPRIRPSPVEALQRAGLDVRPVPVAPRRLLREAVRMAGARLRGEPYVLYGRHRHHAVWRALVAEAVRMRPAVLYLDHLDSLIYASVAPGTPVVIDMHNVYSRLVERTRLETTDSMRRWYLAGEARRLARMERRAAAIAHTILTVSEDDARYFRGLGARRVAVVPNGVDCDRLSAVASRRQGPPTMLFIGSLAWLPNVNAVRFLIRDVLPAVRRRVADARLVVVGRTPPPDLCALAAANAGVEIAANVPDVAPYYGAADALVVPLEAGGGTRLKILEAFAAGVPVLSTPVGCEGIAAVPGRHLLVADRSGFAAAAVRLLADAGAARGLIAAARVLAAERYDWSIVGAAACDAVSAAALTTTGAAGVWPLRAADGSVAAR